MNQRLAREMGERRAALSMGRLLCCVLVWRTVMTRILPLCGSSAWWVALGCLLPGAAVTGLFRLAMCLTGASTVTEALRHCLGKAVAAVFSDVLTALLLVEATSMLTALLTVFTQGVGTRGTQFTLALLTGGVLLCCLHREGLPRAVYLLRWGMLALAMLWAAFALGDVRVDHLFPLHGAGDASLPSALLTGISLGWPLTLLLTFPPCGKQGRLRSGVLSLALAIGLVLLMSLTIPQEVLVRREGLAQWLLLPVQYMPNALRVAGLCLLMVSFFLAVGVAVQLATIHLLAPIRRVPGWLPHGVLVALVLTQAAEIPGLWGLLRRVEPWLLLPLAGLAVLALPMAFIRRNKA